MMVFDMGMVVALVLLEWILGCSVYSVWLVVWYGFWGRNDTVYTRWIFGMTEIFVRVIVIFFICGKMKFAEKIGTYGAESVVSGS